MTAVPRTTTLQEQNPNSPSLNEEDEVRNELTREGSWLADDKSFQHIRSLALKDQIAAITTDIRDTARFHKIAKIYQDNFIEIDSLYLSNICTYMHAGDEQAYASTVHALIQPDTIVINCPMNRSATQWILAGGPTQRVCLGKIFKIPKDDELLFRT